MDGFEWDPDKDLHNRRKHGVGFIDATQVFLDRYRVIPEDLRHSRHERRFYCFGMVAGGVMTVRFTYRGNTIRIIGAGYWRMGKRYYEQQNSLHR